MKLENKYTLRMSEIRVLSHNVRKKLRKINTLIEKLPLEIQQILRKEQWERLKYGDET